MKKKIKFELASQDKTKKMRTYMHIIAKALGHPEALITDESMVSDFLDIFDKVERAKQILKAKKKIKVDICPGDYLWEVAERMQK